MADSKPASTIKLYPLSAAVWRNETKDGKAFYSVTFERSYKGRRRQLEKREQL
jgi:hypothetical protein